MHNMKKSVATSSSLVPNQPSLIRMDPVMPVPNQLWRPVPVNRRRDILTQHLENFWGLQMKEIENIPGPPVRSALPLANIKRLMKYDGTVKFVSSDTPVILAKASELFIMELTLRAWIHTKMSSRQTIQARDIADAVRNSELHNYLDGLVNFERGSVIHQNVPKSALPPQVVPPPPPAAPPATVNVPITKAPLDLDQIMQQSLDSLVADRFIDIGDFELSPHIK